MIEVRAAIEMAASPEAVWRVLTRLEDYPAWNPFIRQARGSLEVGGKVRLWVRTTLGVPLALRARITVRREHEELRWKGNFGGSWIATGDHQFLIERVSPHRVRFEQREVFEGLVPRFLARLLASETQRGFDAMNAALAARATRATPPPRAERWLHATE